MNLTFREMKPEDADAVEAVEKACFAIPWSRESFWKEAANENTCYLLALDGEQVIGYAGCWISFEEAQVTNIAIAPDYRGQKVGMLRAELVLADGDDAQIERHRFRRPPALDVETCQIGQIGREFRMLRRRAASDVDRALV